MGNALSNYSFSVNGNALIADSYKNAAIEFVKTFDGDELGLILQVKKNGEHPHYFDTVSILKEAGIWGGA